MTAYDDLTLRVDSRYPKVTATWACDMFSVGEVLDDKSMTFEELSEHFEGGFDLQQTLDKMGAKNLIILEDGKYRWNYDYST